MPDNLKTFRIALLALMTFFVTSLSAQTVKGNVKDATGEDIIGVTVQEKGTKNIAVTDIDGNFSIKTTGSNPSLTFSYIGMKEKTVSVAGKSVVNVVMEDETTTLEDVVVVGYGTMKKTDLTGSVSSVETGDITAKGASSVLEALQGSVPGVSITKSTGRTNGSMSVEIRGKSSINSSTKPIYVIDGVICDDMDFLNEQDIERIDVLKDASSTAIYGSRATAGVVMVTTKSGQGVGKKGMKPTISYDGYYGITKVARMPDFNDASSFYRHRFLTYNSFMNGYKGASDYTGQPNLGAGDMFSHMMLVDQEGNSVLKQMLANGESYDWPSMVTQDGHQQNHYIAMSGAGEKVNYHMGIGYNDVTGTYKGDEQSRITFKGSVDATLNKIVSAGFSVNFAYLKNKYAIDDMIKYAYRQSPFARPYDSEGNLNVKPGLDTALGTNNGNQFSSQLNPLYYLENNIQTKERDTYRLMGNVYLQIKPIKSLTLKTVFNPTYTYYRDGNHTEYDKDLETTDESTYSTSRSFGYTWDNTITYDETFNKKHHLNVMGLFSTVYNDTEKVSLTQQNVLAGSLWYNLTDPTNMTSSSTSYTENSMISYALRANYTYADKYMITGTVRWDGSSKFADGNRWGSFPSVAVAWRASEEEFMKKLDWLSNLKLRLSYGVTGNCAGIGNYDTQAVVSSTQNYYPFGSVFSTANYASAIVNEALSWETSREWNFGIDFGFLNNRINGSVELYTKKTKDLLFGVTLPLVAGLDSSGDPKTMTTNVGSVRNRGVEISLNTVNIQTKDWRWETTFTFARNKNKILEINGQGTDLSSDNLFIGHPINVVYGYDWLGIISDKNMTVPDNDITRQKLGDAAVGTTMRQCDYYNAVYGLHEGEVIIDDVNGDGTWDDNDKKIWSSDPSWTGSFTSSLSYKDWDFSFSLYTKQNYKVSSAFYGEYYNISDRGRMRLNMDYYIPAGTLIDCDGINADGTYINPVYQETTHYGSFPLPNNNAGIVKNYSVWSGAANTVTDASFVKVKNITLGYTFPKKWMSKIGVSYLRLYCTVTNPFVFTDYKGFDPEWADAALKNDGPSTVTWEFGASLKF